MIRTRACWQMASNSQYTLLPQSSLQESASDKFQLCSKQSLKRTIPKEFCDHWWLFRTLHVSRYSARLVEEEKNNWDSVFWPFKVCHFKIVTTVGPLLSRHLWDHFRCPLYGGVLISEVTWYANTAFGTTISVLNMEVSWFQRSRLARFHCTHMMSLLLQTAGRLCKLLDVLLDASICSLAMILPWKTLIHWLEPPSWNWAIPTHGLALCYREPII